MVWAWPRKSELMISQWKRAWAKVQDDDDVVQGMRNVLTQELGHTQLVDAFFSQFHALAYEVINMVENGDKTWPKLLTEKLDQG